MPPQNIAIIGVGGVGGYFGGKLCLAEQALGLHVSFVARGEHLAAIRERGLSLITEVEGRLVCHPSLATDKIEELPTPDLCLLAVKGFDLDAVLQKLALVVSRDTVILPLLNGVDIAERVRAVIKTGVVLPACVYVGTHIESPGHVRQRGGACKIVAGRDPLATQFNFRPLQDLLAGAGIQSEWTDLIQSEIWQKYIFICAFGLVCAGHNRTLGEVLADPSLAGRVREVAQECATLGASTGTPLPPDIVERSLAKGHGFPPETKTSFQRDVDNPARPDERELFVGSMKRLSEKLGVPIPATLQMAALIEARKPAVG